MGLPYSECNFAESCLSSAEAAGSVDVASVACRIRSKRDELQNMISRFSGSSKSLCINGTFPLAWVAVSSSPVRTGAASLMSCSIRRPFERKFSLYTRHETFIRSNPHSASESADLEIGIFALKDDPSLNHSLQKLLPIRLPYLGTFTRRMVLEKQSAVHPW